MVEKSNTDDINLLFLIKLDDQAALNQLYKKYWKMLFLSAYRILHDQQMCEDITQEIFLKLWDKRQRIEVKKSLKSYLCACIRHEVFRQIRNNVVKEDIFDNLQDRLQTPSEYGNIEHKELIIKINSIVNGLPEKCRQVYKLSREEQLSHKQIAFQLDISTKTVENHLNKALHQLRNALAFSRH